MKTNGHWLFSFKNLCAVLGLNSDYPRGWLLTRRRQKAPHLRLIKTANPSLGRRISRPAKLKGRLVIKEAFREKKITGSSQDKAPKIQSRVDVSEPQKTG